MAAMLPSLPFPSPGTWRTATPRPPCQSRLRLGSKRPREGQPPGRLYSQRSRRNAQRRHSSAQTLKKGMRVFVAGKLVQRSWQDNDGNKRQTVEIQVTPRRTGSPVRYRRGHKVDRRGFGFVLGREVLGRRKADPRRWLRSESLRHSRRLSQATSTTHARPADEPGVRARSKETLAGRCVEHVRERPHVGRYPV